MDKNEPKRVCIAHTDTQTCLLCGWPSNTTKPSEPECHVISALDVQNVNGVAKDASIWTYISVWIMVIAMICYCVEVSFDDNECYFITITISIWFKSQVISC